MNVHERGGGQFADGCHGVMVSWWPIGRRHSKGFESEFQTAEYGEVSHSETEPDSLSSLTVTAAAESQLRGSGSGFLFKTEQSRFRDHASRHSEPEASRPFAGGRQRQISKQIQPDKSDHAPGKKWPSTCRRKRECTGL
eukprot:903995-Rhodomonas_salina.1